MSGKKSELPGFYRDPRTGRYFRESPQASVNPSLKKLKTVREEEKYLKENLNKRPEIPNVMEFLKASELGSVSGLNAERKFLEMKTFHKRLDQEVNLNSVMPWGPKLNIASVDFIKSSENSCFGVWDVREEVKEVFRCCFGEVTYLGAPIQPSLPIRRNQFFITDLCEGPDNFVVYLYNHPLSYKSCYAYLSKIISPGENIEHRYSPPVQSSSTPLFCCASGRGGSVFAIGGERSIRFYNYFVREDPFDIRERVYTLAFNGSADLMTAGLHNGDVYVYDLRQRQQQMELKISKKSINDSLFIDPHQIVVAGPDNVLCKIDLRMKKTVSEYLGHKSSVKKRPFSVASNMLCASGADKTIRLWHLSGGNPIEEIKPFNSPENETRGFLYTYCNKTYLYQFEGSFQRCYVIM